MTTVSDQLAKSNKMAVAVSVFIQYKLCYTSYVKNLLHRSQDDIAQHPKVEELRSTQS